jgi:hypothetical protein
MSLFENLSNDIKSRAGQMADRVQDSELYQKWADFYQGLTPQGQKLTSGLLIASMAAAILYSPVSSLLTSQSQMTVFEDQRSLIKDLFKTYRDSTSESGLSSAPTADQLISQITSQLQSNQLLPEQITSVSQATIEGRLIPNKFVRDVIHVRLAKLNLRQIVDIGHVLNRLSESVKMKDLSIGARSDIQGYFDVTYKLYALNIPEMQIPAADIDQTQDSPRKKKSSSSSSSGGDE